MGTLRPAYHASPTKAERNRRSIYSFQQRSLIDPLIESFNGAPVDLSCERRESSTVPTQAFSLLNSEFSNEMALAMAAQVEKATDSFDAQIKFGVPARVQSRSNRRRSIGTQLLTLRECVPSMNTIRRLHAPPSR